MLYLVQDGLYMGSHEEALLHTLERSGFEYQTYKIIPFTDDLWIDRETIFQSDRSDIFIFGAVKAAHIATKYDWKPGSFYNENHDFTVYSKYYKENMLNYDSIIQNLTDPVNIDGSFFARPTGDTKTFKGEIYENSKIWDIAVSYCDQKTLDKNPLIQICSVKNILQEYRCFVIKGKVITSSMYKMGTRVYYKECFEEDILEYAQNMVDIYQPAEAFVIDVCRTDKGLKIVECNCINCSGFYDINMSKLIQSLEENFG